MTRSVVNITQVRDNLADILGRVKFGEEVTTIEKKGKPYVVMMSPQEYKRYKEVALKALGDTIDAIQAKNAKMNPEEVMEDITKAVEEVRQERYERRGK